MQTHKEWLENEYQQWIEALEGSTVGNFKENSMVRRMLSEDLQAGPFMAAIDELDLPTRKLIAQIDRVGHTSKSFWVSGACIRFIHYAKRVLAINPPSIIEIGGGVGEFFAILRALGYQGAYTIMDLPAVRNFQDKYLVTVENLTGLDLRLENSWKTEFCVSFYALGEFDDENKKWYIDRIVSQCEHGLILWNPHSGASPEIPWPCQVKDEDPLTSPGNKELTW